MTETATLTFALLDDSRHPGVHAMSVRATLASSAHPDAPLILGGHGLRDMLAERLDQVAAKGFDLAHDAHHHPGALALAAASYLNTAIDQLHDRHHPPTEGPDTWPWEQESWHPGDARANIVKALAIGLAVLDRIDGNPQDAGDTLPDPEPVPEWPPIDACRFPPGNARGPVLVCDERGNCALAHWTGRGSWVFSQGSSPTCEQLDFAPTRYRLLPATRFASFAESCGPLQETI